MPQKNATPTREQKDVISRNGLRPFEWVVIKELTHSLIIKHRITHEFRVVEKQKGRSPVDRPGKRQG